MKKTEVHKMKDVEFYHFLLPKSSVPHEGHSIPHETTTIRDPYATSSKSSSSSSRRSASSSSEPDPKPYRIYHPETITVEKVTKQEYLSYIGQHPAQTSQQPAPPRSSSSSSKPPKTNIVERVTEEEFRQIMNRQLRRDQSKRSSK